MNNYADANFLRTRLYNFVAAIQSYVLSQCPSAIFELLWPMDVNDPDNCKLLRYINLPYCAAWEQYQKVRDLASLIAAVAQVYATDPSYAHLATANRRPNQCEAGRRLCTPGGTPE